MASGGAFRVCVRERDRQRDGEREREKKREGGCVCERERERESVCVCVGERACVRVCVSVCVREKTPSRWRRPPRCPTSFKRALSLSIWAVKKFPRVEILAQITKIPRDAPRFKWGSGGSW